MNNINTSACVFHTFMENAAQCPRLFLEQTKAAKAPSYWQEFWAYYAAIRLNDQDYKNKIVERYWTDDENGDIVASDFILLMAYDNYSESFNHQGDDFYKENGYTMLSIAEEHLSSELQDAFDALHALLQTEDEQIAIKNNFYTQQLFIR